MGIPYLYSNIVRKNPSIVVSVPPKCSRLFLDFNSIVHQVVNELKNEVQNEVPGRSKIEFHDIFERIVIHTDEVCKACKAYNPSVLVYIAIDGVAPLAKQNQQRRRRYLSAHTNDIIEMFKKDNQIPFVHWDSNQITPGTAFMKELDVFLKNYYASGQNRCGGAKVIISGSDEPGEGEHKAINYIKKSASDKSDLAGGVDIIYGLDGDLIMLSLTCENPIFLMRESAAVNSDNSSGFKYVNIETLRKAVSLHLYNSPDKRYMHDYVAMCILIGNDFLPNITILKIKFNAIDILCDLYKIIYRKLGENLILHDGESGDSVYTLNYNFLSMLIDELAKKEDVMMENITREYNMAQPHHNRDKNKQNKLDRFLTEIDAYPLRNKTLSHAINPVQNKNWRVDYYHNLFNDHSPTMIKNVCTSFIQGLIWNVNYYFNYDGVHDIWFYEYLYAPCLTDIHKYLTIMGSNEFSMLYSRLDKLDENSVSSDLQLLFVLPPQSVDILPPNLQAFVKDTRLGISHLYPLQFRTSTYFKYQGWEALPILPTIKYRQLLFAYSTIKEK